MASVQDVTVTISAVDRVTPVIRRIRWHLWIWRYADRIIFGMGTVILIMAVVLAFIAGLVSA